MTSKVRSFRYEIVVLALISALLAILTEGGIAGVVFLLLNMTGKNVKPVNIKETIKQAPDFKHYLVYGDNRINKMQQQNLQSYFSTVAVIVFILVIVVGCILFVFYFMAFTKKYSNYLKEIQSGIQELSMGNFENQIPVKYNSEFTVIAEKLNEMSNEIYLLLCDERQNEDVKNELITSVAHDLRTPLTSIIGYLYLVSNKKDLEEEKKTQYTQIAYNKAKRLEQLLEDLFRYTKYSSDEIKLHYETIDFVKFMEQMMEEFYPSFKEAELNYEFQSEMKKAMITADGNLLARAVGNLISNAIKYGKDGKNIKVALKQEENYVIMSVLNYGPIIPKEDIVHIFDRFYRVENSRSEETGGSGLGLAIAKQIITLHNGSIDVQSDYNGTMFEIKLELCTKEGEGQNED